MVQVEAGINSIDNVMYIMDGKTFSSKINEYFTRLCDPIQLDRHNTIVPHQSNASEVESRATRSALNDKS